MVHRRGRWLWSCDKPATPLTMDCFWKTLQLECHSESGTMPAIKPYLAEEAHCQPWLLIPLATSVSERRRLEAFSPSKATDYSPATYLSQASLLPELFKQQEQQLPPGLLQVSPLQEEDLQVLQASPSQEVPS